MKLFSFQPQEVVQELLNGNPYICDPRKAFFLQEEPHNFGFKKAYDWLANKMEDKTPKPDGVSYPVWAWHLIDGENTKPDRRTTLFSGYDKLDTIIELEIPDNEVTLTDFDDWHYVISDWAYQSDEDYEANPEWEPTEEEKLASWDVVFNVNNKKYVQACFWRIMPENIVKIHTLRRR